MYKIKTRLHNPLKKKNIGSDKKNTLYMILTSLDMNYIFICWNLLCKHKFI